MKKKHIFGLAALAVLSSCNQNDFNLKDNTDTDRDNAYMHTWIETFGVPDKSQTWCMLSAFDADINTSSLGADLTTRIYSAAPQNGGKLLAIAQGDTHMKFDARRGTQSVYAEVSDADGSTIAAGTYSITGSSVTIDGSANDGEVPRSRYAHDDAEAGTSSWFNAMIACEDLGVTSSSDFDFNDIVFGLRYTAGATKLYVTPMAAGGTIPASISITVDGTDKIIGDSHQLIDPTKSPKEMLNTYDFTLGAGKTVIVDVPSTWSISQAWADQAFTISVENHGEAYDIKTPGQGEAPKMICLDGDWYWPGECKSIYKAYTGFKAWAQGTGELVDWVDNYADGLVIEWSIDKAANWFSATTADGSNYIARINYSNKSVSSNQVYCLDTPYDTYQMFDGTFSTVNKKITSINLDKSHFDFSNVTTAESMFKNCEGLTSLDLSGWNTSNLTTTQNMFQFCRNLVSLDLSDWDTHNLGNLECMFAYCERLENLNLSGWDLPKASDLKCLFSNCIRLNELDLHTWNIQNATTLQGMFTTCEGLTSLNVSGWDLSKVESCENMFMKCKSLTELDLSTWTNLNKVKNMESMFSMCEKLESLNLSNWNLPAIINMNYMFNRCYKLTNLDLSSWTLSGKQTIASMFRDCNSLTTLNLSGWNVTNVTQMSNMFNNCSSLTTLDISGWEISGTPVTTDMFSNCNPNITIYYTVDSTMEKLQAAAPATAIWVKK